MTNRAKILSLGKAPTREKKIPRSWLRAIGLLKKRKINALGYQKRKRSDWEK